eukprot:6467668-Amphidinium_carterae.1
MMRAGPSTATRTRRLSYDDSKSQNITHALASQPPYKHAKAKAVNSAKAEASHPWSHWWSGYHPLFSSHVLCQRMMLSKLGDLLGTDAPGSSSRAPALTQACASADAAHLLHLEQFAYDCSCLE